MLITDPTVNSLAAPEPSTLVLTVSGLLALGAAGARRRARSTKAD
jgi:hypothetical protein